MYGADIVYGTPSSFSADILRTKFMGMDIRRERPFDIVIVDEVDNMLYDALKHSTQLSGIDPGMHHLQPILASIWKNVFFLINRCIEEKGKLYFSKNPFEVVNGKLRC